VSEMGHALRRFAGAHPRPLFFDGYRAGRRSVQR
jgi:hypothetical protein